MAKLRLKRRERVRDVEEATVRRCRQFNGRYGGRRITWASVIYNRRAEGVFSAAFRFLSNG